MNGCNGKWKFEKVDGGNINVRNDDLQFRKYRWTIKTKKMFRNITLSNIGLSFFRKNTRLFLNIQNQSQDISLLVHPSILSLQLWSCERKNTHCGLDILSKNQRVVETWPLLEASVWCLHPQYLVPRVWKSLLNKRSLKWDIYDMDGETLFHSTWWDSLLNASQLQH